MPESSKRNKSKRLKTGRVQSGQAESRLGTSDSEQSDEVLVVSESPKRKQGAASQRKEGKAKGGHKSTEPDELEQRAVDSLRLSLTENWPPVREEDLDTILGPVEPIYNEWWIGEDERALQHEWDRSDDRRDYETAMDTMTWKERHVEFSKIQSVWKVCLRLFHCSPFALFSRHGRLRYVAADRPSIRRTTTLWSKGFCDDLLRLLCHPIWKHNPDVIALFLQFAIICRTHDPRPWNPPEAGGRLSGLGLEDLFQALKEPRDPTSQSVHELNKKIRATQREAGLTLSIYSDLIDRIGDIVEVRRRSDLPDLSEDTYPVTIKDLKNLIDAINGVGSSHEPIIVSVQVAHQRFMKARVSRDIPLVQGENYHQLQGFYKRSWFHEKRIAKHREEANNRRGSLEHPQPLLAQPNDEEDPFADMPNGRQSTLPQRSGSLSCSTLETLLERRPQRTAQASRSESAQRNEGRFFEYPDNDGGHTPQAGDGGNDLSDEFGRAPEATVDNVDQARQVGIPAPSQTIHPVNAGKLFPFGHRPQGAPILEISRIMMDPESSYSRSQC